MLNSHMPLVVTIMGSTDMEHFYYHRKFYRKAILKVTLKFRAKIEINCLPIFFWILVPVTEKKMKCFQENMREGNHRQFSIFLLALMAVIITLLNTYFYTWIILFNLHSHIVDEMHFFFYVRWIEAESEAQKH